MQPVVDQGGVKPGLRVAEESIALNLPSGTCQISSSLELEHNCGHERLGERREVLTRLENRRREVGSPSLASKPHYSCNEVLASIIIIENSAQNQVWTASKSVAAVVDNKPCLDKQRGVIHVPKQHACTAPQSIEELTWVFPHKTLCAVVAQHRHKQLDDVAGNDGFLLYSKLEVSCG